MPIPELTEEDQRAGWRIDRQADGTFLAFLGGNLAVDRGGTVRAFPSDRAAMDYVLAEMARHKQP